MVQIDRRKGKPVKKSAVVTFTHDRYYSIHYFVELYVGLNNALIL